MTMSALYRGSVDMLPSLGPRTEIRADLRWQTADRADREIVEIVEIRRAAVPGFLRGGCFYTCEEMDRILAGVYGARLALAPTSK